MIDAVLYEIGRLKWTFVIDFSIAIFLCSILLLLTTKFAWKRRAVRFFGLLYNLNEKQAICVGILLARICFVLTNAIYVNSISWGHLAVFIILEICILLFNLDIGLFISDTICFTVIFFLQYIEMSLYQFYQTIDSGLVILLMVIMIGIFSVLYSVQQTLNAYDKIMSKNLRKAEKKGTVKS